jgi:hypothetical protein
LAIRPQGESVGGSAADGRAKLAAKREEREEFPLLNL